MRPAWEAFFLPAPPGQRFCVYHAPVGAAVRGAMVYVHPWAEEMNKSRRMAAMQARALADAGYAVLQIDLHGCGDSSGDFGDADWRGWVDDVVLGAQWLRARHQAPLWLWGLRAGCLIAVQAAQQLGSECHFLFWQPPLAGKALLRQFLRLELAGDLQQGDAKGAMERLRADLAGGRNVDIAGYRLAPGLAAGLDQALLEPPSQPGRMLWLEVSTRADATLLQASMPHIEAWRAKGHHVDAAVVQGPAFWQTQEIEDAPGLISATLAALNLPVAA